MASIYRIRVKMRQMEDPDGVFSVGRYNFAKIVTFLKNSFSSVLLPNEEKTHT